MITNTLYKFMPARKEFFENFLLRASSRNSLNDPFEIMPSTISFAKFLHSIGETRWGHSIRDIETTMKEKKINGIKQYGKIDLFDRTGIISLTETKRNLLMWSHYADSHKGMVVEFDMNHVFFHSPIDGNNFEGLVHRVRYDRDRPDNVKSWYEWFIYKSDEWIYEKEHRLLVPLSHCSVCFDGLPDAGKIIDARSINDCYKDKYLCMFKIPESALVSVTFGVEMSPKVKSEITQAINMNSDLSHLRIYQAVTHPDRYDFEFSEQARNDTPRPIDLEA